MQDRVIMLIILLCMGFSCKPIVDSQFLGPNRNGIYPEEGLLQSWPENGPKLLWKADSIGMGHSSPAVTKDHVFVTGLIDSVGYLFCFDHQGILQWKEVYGIDWHINYVGTRATPTVVGKLLYLETAYGELFCYHVKKRQKIWSRNLYTDFGADSLKYGRAESILIDDDQLFCVPGGPEYNIISLNRYNGKLIWSSAGKREGPTYSSPILIRHHQNTILVSVTSNSIIALDPSDGRLLWTIPHNPGSVDHINTPVYNDGIIYMASVSFQGIGGFTAVELNEDGSSAEVLWKNNNYSNQVSGIIVKDGCLFFSTYRRLNWLCLDATTGDTLYTWSGYPYGNLTLAENKFYVLSSESGEVLLCEGSREGFSTISSFKLNLQFLSPWAPLWAFPVIKEKKLYIRHKEHLFVFDIAQS